ncbi:MAG: site-specific integrase [Nanoarchaeota archaeon]|nr:site-specific integrase [Nanoarchaeota archaeon]
MSQGEFDLKRDRVSELFKQNRLYTTFSPVVALSLELILTTGATPIDLIHIRPEEFEKNTGILHFTPHKKKDLATTTHTLSSEAAKTFFDLEAKKPLRSFSIRRLQQLIKEETLKAGSKLTTPRLLRQSYLQELFSKEQTALPEQTQITSLQPKELLSKQEERLLYEGTYSKRDKTLIITLLQTGIRINELLSLQKKHLTKRQIIITEDISHNGVKRSIPLPAILLEQEIPEGFLFTTNRNNPLSQRRFEQICKEVAQQLHLSSLSPRLLRATAIKNLSRTYTQENLLTQTGLKSSFYTHALFGLGTKANVTTSTSFSRQEEDRKDSKATDANRFMYSRSKLRDGGDQDE